MEYMISNTFSNRSLGKTGFGFKQYHYKTKFIDVFPLGGKKCKYSHHAERLIQLELAGQQVDLPCS